MNICYDQGYNDIEVVIATKLRHNLFKLQPYFAALGTLLPKSFRRAFSSNSRLDVREVQARDMRKLSKKLDKKNWTIFMFGQYL